MTGCLQKSPWSWVPSLYFAEGVPYCLVTMVSVVMLKDLGMGNEELAFWTGLLGLPWVFKPLWSPVVDICATKKRWVLCCELLLAAGMILSAVFLKLSEGFYPLLAVFVVMAFASATHDAAADGFYLVGLNAHRQAWFTGIRSTAYRVAMIVTQGGVVMLAGWIILHVSAGEKFAAWAAAFGLCGAVYLALAVWHGFCMPADKTAGSTGGFGDFYAAFVSFFKKRGVWRFVVFLMVYRLAESQLVRLAAPFFLDPPERGGLGFSVADQGLVYGTIGVICLLAGGVAGGIAVAGKGFGAMILPMALLINLPDIVYVIMSYFPPAGIAAAAVYAGIEQLGYGFGFTGYMLAMVAFAEDSGRYRTSHFAIMTGFMSLGMMLPGMAAGEIQQWLGYRDFFWFVMLCTVPATASILLLRGLINPGFGRKR